MKRELSHDERQKIKRIAAEGLEKRQARGWDPKPVEVVAATPKGGAQLTKAQRKRFTELAEVAVASLAGHAWSDWYEALMEIAQVLKWANFQPLVFEHTCKQIEAMAVEVSGEKDLPVQARVHLTRLRSKITNIAGARPGLSDQGARQHDPLREVKPIPTARPGGKPEPGN